MERCFVYIGDAALNVIESIQIESEKKLEIMDLLAVGAAPIPDNRQPMGYTIKGEITGRPYPYNEDGWIAAREITDALAAIQDEQEPVRLVISRDGAGFSDWVYIRDYRQEETEVSGDFIITIKLIHHVPYGLRELDVPNLPRPGKIPPKPAIISDGQGNLGDQMKNGDTLSPGDKPDLTDGDKKNPLNYTWEENGLFGKTVHQVSKVEPDPIYKHGNTDDMIQKLNDARVKQREKEKTVENHFWGWVKRTAEDLQRKQTEGEYALLHGDKGKEDFSSILDSHPNYH